MSTKTTKSPVELTARELLDQTQRALDETHRAIEDAHARIAERMDRRNQFTAEREQEQARMNAKQQEVSGALDAHAEAQAQTIILRTTPAAKESAKLTAAAGASAAARQQELDELRSAIEAREVERVALEDQMRSEDHDDMQRISELEQVVAHLQRKRKAASDAAREVEITAVQASLAIAQKAIDDAEAEVEQRREALAEARQAASERLAEWPEAAAQFASTGMADQDTRRAYALEQDGVYQTLLAYQNYLQHLSRYRTQLKGGTRNLEEVQLREAMQLTEFQLKTLFDNIPGRYRVQTREGPFGIIEEPDRLMRERLGMVEQLLETRAREVY